MVLLDFIMKGGIYLYRSTLLNLLKELYTDIFHTKSFTIKSLNRFNGKYFDKLFSVYVFAVRFTLGLTTPDEIRNILARYSVHNSEYFLPQSEEGSRSILLRAFKDALEDKAYTAMSRVSDSLGKAYLFMPDLDRLYISPLFHAVVNRIESIRIAQMEFSQGVISLRSAVQRITLGDLDEELL